MELLNDGIWLFMRWQLLMRKSTTQIISLGHPDKSPKAGAPKKVSATGKWWKNSHTDVAPSWGHHILSALASKKHSQSWTGVCNLLSQCPHARYSEYFPTYFPSEGRYSCTAPFRSTIVPSPHGHIMVGGGCSTEDRTLRTHFLHGTS